MYGDVLTETHDRRGDQVEIPVLSVTKNRGPMLASERFAKPLHGRDLSKYRLAPRNTIVADPMLLWDGSIGVQRAADCGVVSPDYRVYVVSTEAEIDYMAHLVRSPNIRRHYQTGARGTNVRRNRIARADFLGIPFHLPPLSEQRKIAAILSSVDEVIEKTKAVIEQLQVVKKAVMHELLTRGFPGRHTRFKQTEIGEIPEEWDVLPTAEMGTIKLGRQRAPKFVGGPNPRPYLRVVNVFDDRLDLRDVKEMDFDAKELDVYRLLPGDVLLTEGDLGSPHNVGRSAVFRGEIEDCCFQNTLIRFRPSERIDSSFAHIAFCYLRAIGQFARRATGTTVYHLGGGRFTTVPMPVPCVEEQAEIGEVISAIDRMVDAEREALSRTTDLKSRLMSVLFTGEVRVTPDEEAA